MCRFFALPGPAKLRKEYSIAFCDLYPDCDSRTGSNVDNVEISYGWFIRSVSKEHRPYLDGGVCIDCTDGLTMDGERS